MFATRARLVDPPSHTFTHVPHTHTTFPIPIRHTAAVQAILMSCTAVSCVGRTGWRVRSSFAIPPLATNITVSFAFLRALITQCGAPPAGAGDQATRLRPTELLD